MLIYLPLDYFKLVDMMVKAGAKRDVKNMNNQTPLDIAVQHGYTDIIKVLEGF